MPCSGPRPTPAFTPSAVTGAGKGSARSRPFGGCTYWTGRIYARFMAVGRRALPTIAAVNGAAVGAGHEPGTRRRCPHRRAACGVSNPQVSETRYPSQRGRHLDAALAVGPAGRAGGPAVDELRRRIGRPARPALRVADDPVAAALELAAGPAAAPREWCCRKASMRATAIPGSATSSTTRPPRTSNSGRRPPRWNLGFKARLAAARER